MMKLFKEVIILIVGGIIFISFSLVGIAYTFFKHIIKFNYSLSKQLAPVIRSITLSLDGLANACSGELLNDVIEVDSDVEYGKWYQTISAITGLIYLYKKDTKLRVVLDKLLGKNHCKESISDSDDFYYKQKLNK